MTKSQLSFRLRQNAPQPMRKEKKDTHKKVAKNQQIKTEVNNTGLFFPAGDTAFKTLLSARFCAAIWTHITDCDETFNYWEPMHYLVYGKGLQTWEYSPEFGLRSYFYLMVHAAPAWIYHKILQPNPLLMFYFVRCLLGLFCALSEVYFYKAICKEFGVHIGRVCWTFQLFAAGFFISSTAFLPSSFAMCTFTAACASWWQQKYALSIFFVALGSLLGWPFAALLGVPIAYDILIRKKLYKDFLFWSVISGVTILIPMVITDSLLYGRLVIAPLNIIKYNVFGGDGPNLYGTEPFCFYLINGFLNFNFIWIFALLSPFAILLNYYCVPSKNKCTLYLPYWLSLSPMYLWLLVFMFQEHKEERFLFPIYPLICLSGAITLDIIKKLVFRVWSMFKKMPPGTHYLDKTIFILIATLAVTTLLVKKHTTASWVIFGLISIAYNKWRTSGLYSHFFPQIWAAAKLLFLLSDYLFDWWFEGISRTFALYKNYHAPLDLMMDINRFPLEEKIPERAQVNVCLGKDWHRYPSSYFLPNKNWHVRFIKSEFDGMLPAPYTEDDNATMIVHEYFNDQNKEVPGLYFDINKCHFLLDLNTGKETDLEPIYERKTDKWKVLKSYSFLIADKSNIFFRAFYVPFLGENFVTYGNFSVLQSTRLRFK